MRYKIQTTSKFNKAFKKLDRGIQRMIKNWIDKNLMDTNNPHAHGKALTVNRSGQWRYRVGDYRLLAEIDDEKIIIIMINVGHRRDVYE